MALVELRDVTKAFPPRAAGDAPVIAVDDVTSTSHAGEVFGIIGYSGAGK